MPVGKSAANSKFCSISKGKIKIYEGKDGNNAAKYAIEDYVEGTLTNIVIDTDEYKNEPYERLTLTIDDNDNVYQLQMHLESGYARAICSMLPNADLTKWIKFTPTYKDDKAGMFMNQGKQSIKWAFTKDNRGDCPPLVQTMFKGKPQWDNTEQMAFFKDLLINKIKPQLGHAIVSGPAQDEAPQRGYQPVDVTEGAEDLPF